MLKWLTLSCVLISLTSFGQNCNHTSVYFGSDKSKISKRSLKAIDSLLSLLDSNSTYLFEFQGFSDKNSSKTYNYKLADDRIKSVKEYVLSRKNVGFVFKSFVYGKSELRFIEDHKNRRVDIYYTQIHTDSTIQIKGENGIKVFMPLHYFQSEICKINPQVLTKSNRPFSKEISLSFDFVDSMTLNWCIPITVRLPAQEFLAADNVDLSSFDFGSCKNLDPSFNNLSKEYSAFTIAYDAETKEFVVTHSCVYPRSFSGCCGTGPGCGFEEESILRTSNTFTEMDYKITLGDSVVRMQDSIYYKIYKPLSRYQNTPYAEGRLQGITKRNDTLFRIDVDILDLSRPVTYVYDSSEVPKFMFCYLNLETKEEQYIPILFSKTNVTIKVPLRANIDSVGFLLKTSRVFIKMEQIDKRCYQLNRIKHPYDFAIYLSDNQVKLKKARLRRKKKKDIYVVRRRDLRYQMR